MSLEYKKDGEWMLKQLKLSKVAENMHKAMILEGDQVLHYDPVTNEYYATQLAIMDVIESDDKLATMRVFDKLEGKRIKERFERLIAGGHILFPRMFNPGIVQLYIQYAEKAKDHGLLRLLNRSGDIRLASSYLKLNKKSETELDSYIATHCEILAREWLTDHQLAYQDDL